MDLKLAGKTAFVSGSTQGIGYATARALLAEGAAVIVNGRSEERVARAVNELSAETLGRKAVGAVSGIAADFTSPKQVERLTGSIEDVDILVNNVGLFEVAPLADIPDDEWRRFFDVNVMSGVRLSRGLLPHMLEKGWGRIIFIGSESGVNVPADMLHYGVTKAGVIALANGLAKLTRGTAVTVNTILGGPTFSEGVASAIDQIAGTQSMSVDELKAAIMAGNHTSLLQRFIEPAELASLAAFLASPLSSATNGAALRADGGVLPTMV